MSGKQMTLAFGGQEDTPLVVDVSSLKCLMETL